MNSHDQAYPRFGYWTIVLLVFLGYALLYVAHDINYSFESLTILPLSLFSWVFLLIPVVGSWALVQGYGFTNRRVWQWFIWSVLSVSIYTWRHTGIFSDLGWLRAIYTLMFSGVLFWVVLTAVDTCLRMLFRDEPAQ